MPGRSSGRDAPRRNDDAVGGGDEQALAERCAAALYARDLAAQLLEIRIVSVAAGRARLAMRVRGDMVNGHAICHGGLVFTLADTAFAYACNSRNVTTVAAGATVDFLAPARAGEELFAEAVELRRSRRSGLYDVTVTNDRGERIALFRGRAHQLDHPVIERGPDDA